MLSRKRKISLMNELHLSDIKTPSTGWFDLPLEMREMVIDEMDPRTRCKFAQCSKICEEEAKKSNKYLNKISVSQHWEDSDELQLGLGHTEKKFCDFWLEFLDARESQTIVVYRCYIRSGQTAKWTKIESGEPKDVRLKYFNEYVNKYKHSIRSFYYDDNETSLRCLKIEHLKKLEEIDIRNVPGGDENVVECGFIDMNKLVWMKSLYIEEMQFTFDQIVSLKGETISVLSFDFDEEKTNKYLKMIKNGEIHENARSIKIHFYENDEVEDVDTIMSGLGAFGYEEWEEGVSDIFKFSSNTKQNGNYRVVFEPQNMIEIKWEQPISTR